MMLKTRKGFTLAELIIGVMITAVLGLTVTKIMTGAQRSAALARCKATLRQDLKSATMYLQRDLANARVFYDKDAKQYKTTIKISGSSQITFQKHKEKNEGAGEDSNDISFFDEVDETHESVGEASGDKESKYYSLYEDVEYNLGEDHALMRTVNGKVHKIAEHIDSLEFPNSEEVQGDHLLNSTYSGKVEIVIHLVAKPDGSPDDVKLDSTISVAVRQLQNKVNLGVGDNQIDNHWKQRVGKSDY